MLIPMELRPVIAEEVISHCLDGDLTIDGTQWDELMKRHGIYEPVPSTSNHQRDSHTRKRDTARREIRQELRKHNFVLILKHGQSGHRQCVHVLRTAVDGNIDLVRAEPEAIGRRAARNRKALQRAVFNNSPQDYALVKCFDELKEEAVDTQRFMTRRYNFVLDMLHAGLIKHGSAKYLDQEGGHE